MTQQQIDTLATVTIEFPINDKGIEELRVKYADVDFSDPEQYEFGRLGLQFLRSLRGGINDTHKVQKESALRYCQKLDAEKRRHLEMVESIEDPLKAKKQIEDDRRQAARDAKKNAEREAVRLAEEAKLAEQKAQLEAQAAALAAQQEAQRLAQAEIEAKQKEARQAEEKRQADERARIDADRKRVDDANAKLEADRATLKAEADRLERSAAAHRQAAHEAAIRAANVEPLTPVSVSHETPATPQVDWVSPPAVSEAESMLAFAAALRAIKAPTVTSLPAAAVLEQVEQLIEEAAQTLANFAEEAAAAAE